MKTQTLKIVPLGEIEKYLTEQGQKHKGDNLAAKQLGVTQPEFSRARRGLNIPPRKLLDVLGLEVRRVIVPKSKGA